MNVLKNKGTHIIHLHRFTGSVHGLPGVVISIAHVINLSAKLLYVEPEAPRVLLNVGINEWNLATSAGVAAVAAQSDIA